MLNTAEDPRNAKLDLIMLPKYVANPESFPYSFSGDSHDPIDVQERSSLASESARAQVYIRDGWIRHQMAQKELEFTAHRGLNVYCGTYNVNGKKPTGDYLDRCLTPKVGEGGMWMS